MKLELKHLAPYLPYELSLVARNVVSETPKRIYGKLTAMNIMSLAEGDTLYKPILRPLSDLTKEITVSGKTFTPIERIQIYDPKNVDYLIEQVKLGLVEVIVFNILLEWHFDVFSLIDNDLAINISQK